MEGFTKPNITPLALDVTSDEDVQSVVQHIHETEGKIDIVFNNAGIPAIGIRFSRVYRGPPFANLSN